MVKENCSLVIGIVHMNTRFCSLYCDDLYSRLDVIYACAEIVMTRSSISTTIFIAYGLLLIFMFYFNVKILRVVRKHKNQIQAHDSHDNNGNGSHVTTSEILGMMMLFMFLSYAPYLVLFWLRQITTETPEFFEELSLVSYTVQMVNSCINPVLFIWKDKRMKQVMKIMLKGDDGTINM